MIPNPYILLGFGLALLAVGFGGYRHGVKTTTDHYTAQIQADALKAERITREAVEAARNSEREQRDRLIAAADAAANASRLEAIAARKRFTDLSRRFQEAADADPTVDAWRVAPVPPAVVGLLSESHH